MATVEAAIALALAAHGEQRDKQDQPYILHLLRVMLAVEETARVVAVLHDLLEDTTFSVVHLRIIECSAEEIEAIQLLTRWQGQDYQTYIERLSANPLAATVKRADLRDNLSRIDGIPERDQARLRPRYEQALAFLEDL